MTKPSQGRPTSARAVRLAVRVVGVGVVGLALGLGVPAAWAASSQGLLYGVEDVPARDVAVILAAEVYADETPSPFTEGRLKVGLALYQVGKAKVLVVSGNNSDAHHHETTAMRRYLEAHGVPAAKIVEDTAGNDTYDTCIRVRDTFGVTSAILVSQTYHLPRAVTTCRALGVDAVGVGDDTVASFDFWPIGVAREFPANVKMVLDLASRRPPEVSQAPSDAVRVALTA
jgi:vancomycin permeability regulator SanA